MLPGLARIIDSFPMKADAADESLRERRNPSATREFWSKPIRQQVRAVCEEYPSEKLSKE